MYATAMPLTGCTAFGMTFKRRQNTAQKEMKAFDWFDRDKIECIFEGRSTSIFVENLETKMRAEITGWTMKYLEVWLASIIFLLLQIIAS